MGRERGRPRPPVPSSPGAQGASLLALPRPLLPGPGPRPPSPAIPSPGSAPGLLPGCRGVSPGAPPRPLGSGARVCTRALPSAWPWNSKATKAGATLPRVWLKGPAQGSRGRRRVRHRRQHIQEPTRDRQLGSPRLWVCWLPEPERDPGQMRTDGGRETRPGHSSRVGLETTPAEGRARAAGPQALTQLSAEPRA